MMPNPCNNDLLIWLMTGMIVILLAYATWLNIVWQKTRMYYHEASQSVRDLIIENAQLLLTLTKVRNSIKGDTHE